MTRLLAKPARYCRATLMRSILPAMASVWMLVACGGGDPAPRGGSVTTAPSAPANAAPPPDASACPQIAPTTGTGGVPQVTAVVGGQLTSDIDRNWLIAVMRDDGTTLAFYGPGTSLATSLGGYMYSGGPWWSSDDPGKVYNGRDWGHGGEAACLQLTYDVTLPSLAGSLTLRNGFTSQIEGGSIPGSAYRFSHPVNLAGLAGMWALQDAAEMTIAEDGSLRGTYQGCLYNGSVVPAASGTGTLGVSIEFDAACTAREAWARSLKGFAVPYLSSDGATRVLLFAEADNGVDSSTIAAVGQKQP